MFAIERGPKKAHQLTDPRFQSLGEHPQRTIARQVDFCMRSRQDLHPDVLLAKRITEERHDLKLAQSGAVPYYILGIARNPQKHYLYKGVTPEKAKAHETIAARNEVSFIQNLISQTSPDSIVGEINHKLKKVGTGKVLYTAATDSIYKITAGKYYSLLTQNEILPSLFIKDLNTLDTNDGNSNQCAGIGSFCERRVGLVLARLLDAGFIRGFELFSEAAMPLATIDNKAKNEVVNYRAGEEAMGIDIMVRLDSGNAYEYAPLQIKAQGPEGFRSGEKEALSIRYLSFDKNELKELIDLMPEAQNFFQPDPEKPDKYLLSVARDIFKLSVADRTLYKNSYADNRPDIANFLLASFEHMVEKGKVLSLDRPYQSLSYPERVSELIKAGFLTMQKFKKTKTPVKSRLILPNQRRC